MLNMCSHSVSLLWEKVMCLMCSARTFLKIFDSFPLLRPLDWQILMCSAEKFLSSFSSFLAKFLCVLKNYVAPGSISNLSFLAVCRTVNLQNSKISRQEEGPTQQSADESSISLYWYGSSSHDSFSSRY